MALVLNLVRFPQVPRGARLHAKRFLFMLSQFVFNERGKVGSWTSALCLLDLLQTLVCFHGYWLVCESIFLAFCFIFESLLLIFAQRNRDKFNHSSEPGMTIAFIPFFITSLASCLKYIIRLQARGSCFAPSPKHSSNENWEPCLLWEIYTIFRFAINALRNCLRS